MGNNTHPDKSLNSFIRPLYWEPVFGTGERITVGMLTSHEQQVAARRIVSSDRLEGLFQRSGIDLAKMLDFGIKFFHKTAQDDPALDLVPKEPVFGLYVGCRVQVAAECLDDAIQIGALMFSSLCMDSFRTTPVLQSI